MPASSELPYVSGDRRSPPQPGRRAVVRRGGARHPLRGPVREPGQGRRLAGELLAPVRPRPQRGRADPVLDGRLRHDADQRARLARLLQSREASLERRLQRRGRDRDPLAAPRPVRDPRGRERLDNAARSSYSAYHGGPRRYQRYRTPDAPPEMQLIDQAFWDKYQALSSGQAGRSGALHAGQALLLSAQRPHKRGRRPSPRRQRLHVHTCNRYTLRGLGGPGRAPWLATQPSVATSAFRADTHRGHAHCSTPPDRATSKSATAHRGEGDEHDARRAESLSTDRRCGRSSASSRRAGSLCPT